MSYPGLAYPTDANTLNSIKEQGYFILVDRNANNIALVPGGEISTFLNSYQDWIFVFGMNIVGTRQDIIDALYLLGYDVNQIGQIIGSGISIENVNSQDAQQWIAIFKQQNAPEVANIQKPVSPPRNQPNYFWGPAVTDYPPYTFMPHDPGYAEAVQYQKQKLEEKGLTAQQSIINNLRSFSQNAPPQTTQIGQIGEPSLNVGDIVSYTVKGQTVTGVINKVNPKTYQIGTTRVPRQLVRYATANEIQTMSPAATTVATKNNFYIGQEVQFEHKGQLYRGQISKLNPAKATIGIYHVPYVSLMAV